ncbi:MAG: dipeptide ABC transporter ATP-binding protein [Streptosporangiaceae bacterium]
MSDASASAPPPVAEPLTVESPALEVRSLSTELRRGGRVVHAVRDVSLTVGRGQKVGIVGESGSGKSTLALSVLGLIDPPGRVQADSVRLAGREAPIGDDRSMARLRGRIISLVPQDPMAALDPVKPIGKQVEEAIRRHHKDLSRAAVRRRAAEALQAVELPQARARFDAYPHQFSGGMLQRVAIAIALVNQPDVVVADEPTTALDVTTQAQVLALLERLVQDQGSAIVLITHDVNVVAQFCDQVMVMYAGRIVERSSVAAAFGSPAHPYTQALLRAVRVPGGARVRRLPIIPGSPPDLTQTWAGCSFQPRCTRAEPVCSQSAPIPGQVLERPDAITVAECHFAGSPAAASAAPPEPTASTELTASTASAATPARAGGEDAPLLQVTALRKNFSSRRRRAAAVTAVNDVSFQLRRGETLGLVGETGSGKSTIARLLVRLVEPTGGRIDFDGQDITTWPQPRLRALRRRMQIVFQDSYGALDPRMPAGAIIEEGLVLTTSLSKSERRGKVETMLASVGLSPRDATMTPHQFSGGQRQRIGIARALIMSPELVVLDEPISALDVSIQAQILNLLWDMKEQEGLTYLFITHDLVAAEHFCDRIIVLYQGEVMELGDSAELFRRPLHPYTVALLSAAPHGQVLAGARNRVMLRAEAGPAAGMAAGCPLEPRCPVGHGRDVCRSRKPGLSDAGPGHQVACHFPGEMPGT